MLIQINQYVYSVICAVLLAKGKPDLSANLNHNSHVDRADLLTLAENRLWDAHWYTPQPLNYEKRIKKVR